MKLMKHFALIALLLFSTQAFARIKYIEVTPAISAAAYSADDIVGVPTLVYSLPIGERPIETLGSLILIDKAKQKKDTDIYFFSSLPTVSADNAAWDLNDAMSLKIIGSVNIAAADYIDSASNSSATKKGISLAFPYVGGQSIYLVVVTRGTPTYASTSDLVLRIGFYEDSQ